MKIKGEITLNYKNEESASLIYNSLEIDNENYLESNLDKRTVNYQINSESLGSFLATVDDLIASEIVAEKIIEKTNKQ
ncbi:KEOPS complex subunit Pcc1 [uncultured Methanobrevibacter sp.]|uniref:KEOPS complex subunit Pcc1 n=1 Tax=uncultured Methanobrevibacter sp. TaxID=253161 RepID=UPI0026120A9B|nr:KEOPS complex subunit Pcc1 [uncultured Methanobrevibacter sp.]